MIVWWTNRGFISLLTLIGVFGLFGAAVSLTVGEDAFRTSPWLWGAGLLLPALVNWFVGCQLNRVPLSPFVGKVTERFIYRAPNRFLSFPMEAWSYPLAIVGLVLIVLGLIGT